MQAFANTPEAAWFSFTAAIVALPLFAITRIIGPEDGVDVFRVIADLGPYAVSWLLFPVVMLRVAPAMQCEQHYCRYINALNWCAVFEAAVMTVFVALEAAGLVPEQFSRPLFLMLIIWVLTYQFYVAKTALQIEGSKAALLVGLRLVLDLAIVAVGGILGGVPAG